MFFLGQFVTNNHWQTLRNSNTDSRQWSVSALTAAGGVGLAFGPLEPWSVQKFWESSTELALHPLFLRGWLFVRLSLVTWKTNAFLQTKEYKEPYPHIQKSSSSNPALFVAESTSPRMIKFIRKPKEKWLFAQKTSNTISTNIKVSIKIWCALKVSGGVGLAFGPLEPLSLTQSIGQWERLHSATFTFCQAFCSTAKAFVLNLHVFMSEGPTIRSSLACDLIHKNLTNRNGKAWRMILKLQKQIQRAICSCMVLLSASFHVLLD